MSLIFLEFHDQYAGISPMSRLIQEHFKEDQFNTAKFLFQLKYVPFVNLLLPTYLPTFLFTEIGTTQLRLVLPNFHTPINISVVLGTSPGNC